VCEALRTLLQLSCRCADEGVADDVTVAESAIADKARALVNRLLSTPVNEAINPRPLAATLHVLSALPQSSTFSALLLRGLTGRRLLTARGEDPVAKAALCWLQEAQFGKLTWCCIHRAASLSKMTLCCLQSLDENQ
jgi:hypothetical protein